MKEVIQTLTKTFILFYWFNKNEFLSLPRQAQAFRKFYASLMEV